MRSLLTETVGRELLYFEYISQHIGNCSLCQHRSRTSKLCPSADSAWSVPSSTLTGMLLTLSILNPCHHCHARPWPSSVPPSPRAPSARCLSPAPSADDAPDPTAPTCLTTREALQRFALSRFPRLLLFSQMRLMARGSKLRLVRQPDGRWVDDARYIFKYFSYSIFIVEALIKGFLLVVLRMCARVIFPQDSHDYYAF